MKLLPTLCALTLPLVLGACGHDPALDPYAKATLTAGVGLGDLQLGQTTLASVVEKLGVDSVTQLRSEEVGLELLYEHGQLALLFMIDPGCLSSVREGSLRPAAVDLPGFLARNPCLGAQRLSSLSLRVGQDADDTFFQGATEASVRLWGPQTSAAAHGKKYGGSGQLLAGMNPNNPQDQQDFPSGICFYSKHRNPDGSGELYIQRITIYSLGR